MVGCKSDANIGTPGLDVNSSNNTGQMITICSLEPAAPSTGNPPSTSSALTSDNLIKKLKKKDEILFFFPSFS